MVVFVVGVGIESMNAVNREAIPPVLQLLAYNSEFFIFKIRSGCPTCG
jgi:hypothetical protein